MNLNIIKLNIIMEEIKSIDIKIKKLIYGYTVSYNPKKYDVVLNLLKCCGKDENIINEAIDLLKKRFELLKKNYKR